MKNVKEEGWRRKEHTLGLHFLLAAVSESEPDGWAKLQVFDRLLGWWSHRQPTSRDAWLWWEAQLCCLIMSGPCKLVVIRRLCSAKTNTGDTALQFPVSKFPIIPSAWLWDLSPELKPSTPASTFMLLSRSFSSTAQDWSSNSYGL